MRKWFLGVAITLFAVFFMTACNGIINDEDGDLSQLLESSPIVVPVEVFERVPASGISRNYNDILSVDDGWIAVGRSHGAPLDAIIVKYDKQGYKVWERGFGTSNSLDEFYSIIEISGSYIVRANLSPDGRGISVIIKFDKEGNLIWAKDLSVNTITVNETGFIGAGGIKSATQNTLFIAQFDIDGNILLYKPIGDSFGLYGTTNPYDNEVLNISEIINGSDGYFLCGETRFVGFMGDFSEGSSFIAYLNKDGNFNWQRTMNIVVDDVILTSDGIVVTGVDYTNSKRTPIIKKFDFEMNVTWEVPYEQNNYIVFEGLTKVGDDVFASAFRAIGGGAFISGISADGKRFWDSDVHINEKYVLYNNIFSIDGGFAVNVYYSSSGKNSFLLYDSTTLTFSTNDE